MRRSTPLCLAPAGVLHPEAQLAEAQSLQSPFEVQSTALSSIMAHGAAGYRAALEGSRATGGLDRIRDCNL